MVVSYQWLCQYLPQPLPIAELSNILTSIGLEVEAVEAVETIKGSLEGLVIGHVLTCEKHPNADKLNQTTVDIGTGEALSIVCGAPNVAAGQKVIVAPVGCTVYPTNGEAFLIKKAKIRGAESQGMICAEDEIGLSADHGGIMILPADAPIGMLAKAYFNIPTADMAIHIGLTPNRTDAMSHIGVARDVCAYLAHHKQGDYTVQLPQYSFAAGSNEPSIKVNIHNTEACPRYCGISISNITVAPSPEWLQQRLKTIGLRAINNIVDATNFVLHEYGQPLHAFDADKIKGKEINVRLLLKGTAFTTLDNKEVKLEAHDLMICDKENGMCMAGVYGGANSGVSEGTKNVFLESAYFHPTYIRRSSMHHGFRTDAATHFEKGVDVNNLLPALKRAAALIVEIAGGQLEEKILDIYPTPLPQVNITVSYDYITKLSGKDYGKDATKKILTSLGFVLGAESEKTFSVSVPTNKADVTLPADIVEEVLRIDGLDNIAIPERLNISLMPAMPNDRAAKQQIAEQLCGQGFQEIITNSITNSKYYPERTDMVKMLNSLSSELDILRPSMLETGLEVINHNCNRKNNDLALFQYGNVYTTKDGKYVEDAQLALYLTGHTQQTQWNQPAKAADLFYLKGIVANLILRSGIEKTIQEYDDTTAIYKWKNQLLCSIAVVDSKKLAAFEIKQPVYYAVINWALWQKAAAAQKINYTEVPKHPAVQRDLAMVLDKTISYQQVQIATEQLNISALKHYGLFDIFESEKLGADKKSFALNYTFQLQDRTLTEAEIEQVMTQLINTYKAKLNAQIRD